MSDGSDSLRFLDPNTLREVRTLPVTAGGEPVPQLNELEWINGEIWANIWMDDRIARIRPDTGEVSAFVDLTGNPAAELSLPGDGCPERHRLG